jgi:hypothetical protein
MIDELTRQMNIAEQESTIPNDAVETAIMVYLAAKAEQDRFKELQDRAKLIISDVMAELGMDKITTQAGVATVSSASKSVRYDTKALDALAASSDEIARILEPHRKETMRMGSLSIRAAK